MPEGLLQGKRGLVFGVANERSIAWGCAQACKAHGAEMLFSFLGEAQEKRVRKLLEELPGAECFSCDVGSDESIASFFEAVRGRWDCIDFLIHSVAYADKSDLGDSFVATSRKNFAMALDISAYSLVALTRAAEPLFTNGGSVVAMTYYGAEKAVPKYNVMGVAKAALEASARYLARDLGPKNIRVNCVSAGPIKTLSASAVGSMKQLLRMNEVMAPLRRNVTTEDVGKTTVYLLSELSSGVTGEVVHVDSGYNILGAPSPEALSQLQD